MLYKIRKLAFVLIVLSAVLVIPPGADLQAQGQGPDSQQIFGLGGTVQAAVGHPFGHYYAADDGVTYGLLGATPAVEGQLGVQARDFPTGKIKIWGAHMPESDGYPIILVTDVLVPRQDIPAATPTVTPTPQPTITPTPQPQTVVVKQDPVYLRTGPHFNFPRGILAPAGTVCSAYARNRPANWILVACTNGGTGWLRTDRVLTNGDVRLLPVLDTPPPPSPSPTFTPGPTSTPKPTATPRPPTATPKPPPKPTVTPRPPTATPKPPAQPQTGQWRARYYDNIHLAGNPVEDRVEGRGPNYPLQKTFNGSPAPGVPNMLWTARYDGPFWFSGGDFIFNAQVDGGIRVYLDDHLLLDGWSSGNHRMQNTFQNVGAGVHRVRVEYLPFYGRGSLNVWWDHDDGRNRD